VAGRRHTTEEGLSPIEQVELMNMCMIEDPATGRILVQRRIKGSWTGVAFPGGHVELGEGIIDSTIREVKEETGLDVSDLQLAGIKQWYSVPEAKRSMVFLFTTTHYTGELLTGGEEGKVFWVKKEDFRSLNLASGMSDTFEVLTNPLLTEESHVETEENCWEMALQ
jgi:8-oxo-dGTP diphosphatase